MNFNDLQLLPLAEKLDLVERLWDDIGASKEPLPLPEWAVELGKSRLAEMKADRSKNLSAEEVWRRVDNRG